MLHNPGSTLGVKVEDRCHHRQVLKSVLPPTRQHHRRRGCHLRRLRVQRPPPQHHQHHRDRPRTPPHAPSKATLTAVIIVAAATESTALTACSAPPSPVTPPGPWLPPPPSSSAEPPPPPGLHPTSVPDEAAPLRLTVSKPGRSADERRPCRACDCAPGAVAPATATAVVRRHWKRMRREASVWVSYAEHGSGTTSDAFCRINQMFSAQV